jgi:predicted nucleic acid-binding protein
VSSAFIDTNVLLYLMSGDTAKADTAEALLAGGGAISVQVLNEFAHVARRKFRAPWIAIRESLDAIRLNVDVRPVTIESHDLGLRLADRYVLSVFDGQLLASAILAGCDLFYSEDMQHGQVLEGLTLRNPFSGGPL